MTTRSLPLKFTTPHSWASVALKDPIALLNDHAHLEKKAATNALDLLPCWPEPDRPSKWVRVLSSIARDEVEHLAYVVKLLERRGGEMSRSHRSPYAQSLRTLVRKGTGPLELGDRLMVSSLIEARSCERFSILAESADDPELAKLYKSLWASEHGHYQVFLDLACQVLKEKEVKTRWDYMLEQEARIISEQKPGSGMHTGL